MKNKTIRESKPKDHKCEPTDILYLSYPPQWKCKICGKFYADTVYDRANRFVESAIIEYRGSDLTNLTMSVEKAKLIVDQIELLINEKVKENQIRSLVDMIKFDLVKLLIDY